MIFVTSWGNNGFNDVWLQPSAKSANTLPHSSTVFAAAVITCMNLDEWHLTHLSLALCVLRNLSSVNEKTRQQMRETQGLVHSLVGYIKASCEDNKAEDKVRQENMELNLSCCSVQVLCIHLSACVCLCVCVYS